MPWASFDDGIHGDPRILDLLNEILTGELTAISYLAPLFGTLGAVLFLGEVVRIRRWTALAVGLASG